MSVAQPWPRKLAVKQYNSSAEWEHWLQEQTTGWRTNEWNEELLIFTGDPDNPLTKSNRCECGAITVESKKCGFCRRKQQDIATGVAGAEHRNRTRWHLPDDHPDKPECLVHTPTVDCSRKRYAHGLCEGHYHIWYKSKSRKYSEDPVDTLIEKWLQQDGIPPVNRRAGSRDNPPCIVKTCDYPQITRKHPLCRTHKERRERDSKGFQVEPAVWAQTAAPILAPHQFWMGNLPETLRLELIYAFSIRDSAQRKLSPERVRLLIKGLIEKSITSIVDLTDGEIHDLETLRSTMSYRSTVFEVCRDVWIGYRKFANVDLWAQTHWDFVELGLVPPERNHPHNRLRRGIDFEQISQPWLRSTTMEYCRDLSNWTEMQDAFRTSTIASEILFQRADEGLDPGALTKFDAESIGIAFANRTDDEGMLFGRKYRKQCFARFFGMIQVMRDLGKLDILSLSFSTPRNLVFRESASRFRSDRQTKSLPDLVLQALDQNIHLIEPPVKKRSHYSYAEFKAAMVLVYILMRDTGRRPIEICSLSLDCLGGSESEPVLKWHNHKAGRPGADLPISVELTKRIQEWLIIRSKMIVADASSPYLFPGAFALHGETYLAPKRFSSMLREWVARIGPIPSGKLDDNGEPIPFDPRDIYPYALRHTFAQRLADGEVPVDTLAKLLDHSGLATVGTYYQVNDRRKRSAIEKVAHYTFDSSGQRQAAVDATTYELRSIAVPYGNCTEPSNVKSGGKSCPIRFQCGGCGFYRPDASHLDSIKSHIRSIRLNLEEARSMSVSPYIIDGLEEEIATFTKISSSIEKTIEALSESERRDLDEATKYLTENRSGRRYLSIEPESRLD